jgi:hypothetical protein
MSRHGSDPARLAFAVPNNRQGRSFLAALRRFRNRDRIKEVVARPRGSRKAAKLEGHRLNAQRDMPSSSKHLAGWAVYLEPTKEALEVERRAEDRRREVLRRHVWERAERGVREFIAGELKKVRDELDNERTAGEASRVAFVKELDRMKADARGHHSTWKAERLELNNRVQGYVLELSRERREYRRCCWLARGLGLLALAATVVAVWGWA